MIQLTELDPCDIKYTYFNTTEELVNYVSETTKLFQKNNRYTVVLEVIPNRNQVKTVTYDNYIWITEGKYLSLN